MFFYFLVLHYFLNFGDGWCSQTLSRTDNSRPTASPNPHLGPAASTGWRCNSSGTRRGGGGTSTTSRRSSPTRRGLQGPVHDPVPASLPLSLSLFPSPRFVVLQWGYWRPLARRVENPSRHSNTFHIYHNTHTYLYIYVCVHIISQYYLVIVIIMATSQLSIISLHVSALTPNRRTEQESWSEPESQVTGDGWGSF